MLSQFNIYFTPIYIVCRIILMWQISLDDSKKIFNYICTVWKMCFLIFYTYSCYDCLKLLDYINYGAVVMKYSDIFATTLSIINFYLYIFINIAKRHNIKKIFLSISHMYLNNFNMKINRKIMLCQIILCTSYGITFLTIAGYIYVHYLENVSVTNPLTILTPFLFFKIENCVTYFIVHYLKLHMEEIHNRLKHIYLSNEIVIELIVVHQEIIDILNKFASTQVYYIIIFTINSFIYCITLLNYNIQSMIHILQGKDNTIQIMVNNLSSFFSMMVEIFISVFIFCNIQKCVSIIG